MKYGYIVTNRVEELDFSQAVKSYMEQQTGPVQLVEDSVTNKVHWEKRKISEVIADANAGDTIVIYEASDLARSTSQVLEILLAANHKGIAVYFIRHDLTFDPSHTYTTDGFLKLMKVIENEYVTKRTTDALARRRAAGLPLGRPKGRKNKSRKLDKHKADIKKYLSLNINKSSIAKLVGCHAQTLYNYLEDNDLLTTDGTKEEMVG